MTKNKLKAITCSKRHVPLADRGYYFMPASIDTLMRGLSLAVRYEKNPEYKITSVGNGFVFSLPDRTVHASRSFYASEKRSPVIDADQVLDLDPYLNKSWIGKLGLSFAMVNASAVTKQNMYPDYDAEIESDWPYIVADSGGFQLARGVEEFLDPKDIVERHNKICDIGVALDIPVGPALQKTFLVKAAQIQAKNNEVFAKYKRKSLHIQNIFHGLTFYARSKFRDLVEGLDTPRCCIAGLRSADLVPLVLGTLQVMTTGRKYSHYHVLGASGLERLVALSYIGHKKLAPVLTSDSSTHIQQGLNLAFANPLELFKYYDLRSSANKLDSMTLPCSCDVCHSIKYAKVLTDKAFTFAYETIVLHNLIVMKNQLDALWDITALPKKEILAAVKPYCSENSLKTINLALSAIDMALEDSVEKAAKKYAPFLLEKWYTNKRGIFSTVEKESENKGYKRVNKVISRYEKYYGLKL